MLPVRVIGTTGAQGSGTQMDGAPQVQQRDNSVSEQSLARGTEYVEQAGQSLQRGFEVQQQVSASLSENAQRKGASPGIAGALTELAKAAQAFGEMQQSRAKAAKDAQDELDDSLDAQQRVFAMQGLQDVVQQARGIIEQETYERGVPIVRDMVTRVLGDFENLKPETVSTLMNSVFSELDRINGEQWREAARNKREAREAVTSAAFESAKVSVQGRVDYLAQRGAWLSEEQQYDVMNEIVETMMNVPGLEDMDETTRLNYFAQVMRHVGGSLSSATSLQQEVFGEAERYEAAVREIQGAQLAYDNGQISAEELHRTREEVNIRMRTNVSGFGVRNEIQAHLEEARTIGELQELQRAQAYEHAGELESLEVGKIVAGIIRGDYDRTRLDPDDPSTARVEAILREYQDFERTRTRLSQEGSTLRDEENRLRREMQRDEQLARAYDRMTATQRAAAGSEYKRAHDNFISGQSDAHNRLQEIGRRQLELQREMEANQSLMIPYGLQQGAESQLDFYNSPQAVQQRQEAQAALAERQAAGQASFNYGDVGNQSQPPRPLARLAAGSRNTFGLAEGAPIPFGPQSSNIVVTSGWSGHAGGRANHGGIDFAPTSGGPREGHDVVAIRTGRVVQSTCSGGWGCHVLIEDQQGNRAVYAHLASQPSLRPGEIVSQGTRLGEMGWTGNVRPANAQGTHLHFAVLKPGASSEGGGRNTLDPVAYINESINEGAVQTRGLGMPPTGQRDNNRGAGSVTPGLRPQTNTSFQIATEGPPPGAYILPDRSGWVYGNTMFFTSEDALQNALTRREARATSISAPATRTGPGGAPATGSPTGGPGGNRRSAVGRGSLGQGYEALEELGSQLPQLSTRFSSETPQGVAAQVLALAIGGTEVYSRGSNQRDFFSRRGGATLDGRPNTMLGFGQFNQDYHAQHTQNPRDYANYIGEMLTGARAQPNGSQARDFAGALVQAFQSGQLHSGQQLGDWIRASGLGGSNWQGISDGWSRVPGLEQHLFRVLRESLQGGRGGPDEYNPQTPEEIFHGANPSRNNRASNDRGDYGDLREQNNEGNNYGYEALESDDSFRTALSASATRLGVPAQWLADVMALQTRGTFSPREVSQDGSGCVGLISICPDQPNGGTATINGNRVSIPQIAQMTRTEQMQLVEGRLQSVLDAAGQPDFQHAHQLLMAVMYGEDAFMAPSMIRRTPGFEDALSRLGGHVGRRYQAPWDNLRGEEVHEELVSDCPYCNSLAGSGSFISHVLT